MSGRGGISNILSCSPRARVAATGGRMVVRPLYLRDAKATPRILLPHWTVKLKRLLLCALIEFISSVFSLAPSLSFSLFQSRSTHGSSVVPGCDVAARRVGLLSRLFLAPRSPALRLLYWQTYCYSPLPLAYAFVLFLGASFLIRGLLELQG